VIQITETKLKTKLKRSEEICERLFKKAKKPGYLTAQEMWRIHKGGRTSEDVPVEFIVDYAKKQSVRIDLEGFDKLFIEDTEKSLMNLKNVRHENTQLIDICSKLKQAHNIPMTKDDFKYNYELDTVNEIARYKEGKKY
jgi:alanyl-tRNA synthetase